MSQHTKGIFKYLIELLLVVVGVFLGIYVSEIRGDEQTRKQKAQSISYITEEVINNKSKLERSIKYHRSIKTEIDSIAQLLTEEDMFEHYIGNDIFRHNEIKGWKGIGVNYLESTAFEAAKISGIITEYDIEIVKEISTIYNYQAEYLEFGNSILKRMINMNSSSKVIDAFS
ncbi:MAG: hypothetical protein AAF847_17075, partial [Bacteroidota bacterium]